MGEQDAGALDVGWMVRRAAEGDHRAWERLVEQYARLIWAMTRDFKLVESDAADVAQVTWLRLLENIDRLESPDHVGSWLATTARRECLRSVAARKKVVLVDDDGAFSGIARDAPQVDERLLADERAQAVREAVSSLPLRWQRLLGLLMSDPPVSYAEISDELGLPIGSIGPTRARCLAKLRVVLQAQEAIQMSSECSVGLVGLCTAHLASWVGHNPYRTGRPDPRPGGLLPYHGNLRRARIRRTLRGPPTGPRGVTEWS